jgi:hypothetical protein
MASQIRTAWERSADGRSSVASELETIFAPLPRPAAAAAPAPSAKPRAIRRRGLPPWLWLLGAIALAALIGSLAFLTPVARTSRVPGTHPIKAPPPSIRTTTSPQAATTLPSASSAPPAAQPKVAAARPSAQPHKSAPPPRQRHCSRYATEAWCLHGRIMAADDELRDAYNSAVRAGVDRHTLIDIRHDWKRLRGRANRDPRALIRGYALLTQALRAERRRAHR